MRRAVPTDIGQGMALSLLQGQAVGIKQMTTLAADAEGEPLADLNMAVTSYLSSEGGVILELQIAIGSVPPPAPRPLTLRLLHRLREGAPGVPPR